MTKYVNNFKQLWTKYLNTYDDSFTYEGGYNYHSCSNVVYSNVVMFDFKELYPSIICGYRLEPSNCLGAFEV